MTTNIFEKLPEIFTDDKPECESIQLIGRLNNERVIKFVPKKYIKGPGNLDKYKVILPKANGSGAIGEVLSTPLVGHTQTFISIGKLETLDEANSLFKYIKSKFARTLLGVLKITQDNKKGTWNMSLSKTLRSIRTLIGHNQWLILTASSIKNMVFLQSI